MSTNDDAADEPTTVKAPTSIFIDMFTGFQFESLTSLDLMGETRNEAVPGGFKFVAKNQFVTIFLKEVSFFSLPRPGPGVNLGSF